MEFIFTEKAPSPAGHYSQAIVSGGLVFVSGQLPIHPQNGEIKLTIEGQVHQVMNNLENILATSGSSMDKVRLMRSMLSALAHINPPGLSFPLVNCISDA